MTYTTSGTWRQIFGFYIGDGLGGPDPDGELNLTDDQRKEMDATVRIDHAVC